MIRNEKKRGKRRSRRVTVWRVSIASSDWLDENDGSIDPHRGTADGHHCASNHSKPISPPPSNSATANRAARVPGPFPRRGTILHPSCTTLYIGAPTLYWEPPGRLNARAPVTAS